MSPVDSCSDVVSKVVRMRLHLPERAVCVCGVWEDFLWCAWCVGDLATLRGRREKIDLQYILEDLGGRQIVLG